MEGQRPVHGKPSFFKELRLAIQGKEKNFTEGSLRRAMFMLAVPMILEMVMESLFAVADIFFVSQVSVEAVAAVGLTESILAIVYSVAMGLSMGAMAMISRRVGEKKPEKAAEVAVNALITTVGISLLVAVPGITFAPDILRLMGGSESLVATGTGYIRWMMGGNVTIMLLFLINAIFRGAGDAAVAMRVLWLSNGLNMVLDPLFIFGWGPFPEMGVTGAAVATNIGRGVGVSWQLYLLFRSDMLIKLTRKALVLSRELSVRLLKISAGGMGQFLISSASWIFLARIVAISGSEALAGYTIAIRIIIFTILPSWGLANAAATLVGQNLGAGQPERAEKSAWLAAWYNAGFLAFVTLLFFLWSDGFIQLFSAEEGVVAHGTMALRVISLGYIFYALEMVLGQCFNGAGDTRTPTILNLAGYWLVQIPLAWVLAVEMGYGATGVFAAIAISSVMLALGAVLLFRRGKWKHTVV